MSLSAYRASIEDFSDRIKQSLQLADDEENMISSRKAIISWIQDETYKLKEEKEKKSDNFITGFLNYAGIGTHKKLQNAGVALEKIKSLMKGSFVDFDDKQLEQFQLPKQLLSSLRNIKRVMAPTYYGTVSSPLMKSSFLISRQNFDNCIKKGKLNGLKFINLGSDCANVVKFQRSTLQQLLNRLINTENQLSTVIKIEVEDKNFSRNIEFFCYVEDESWKKDITFKELANIETETDNLINLFVEVKGKKIPIDQLSVLNSFVIQMIIVPIQTLVSDYIIAIDQKKGTARLVKAHSSFENGEEVIYLKQHPSLRNPLFFFNNYIRFHQFDNKEITEKLQIRQSTANFYEILNIIVQFVLNDFNFRTSTDKMNSLCFDQTIFNIIWKLIHQMMIMANWIEEIINPIKKGVSLYEINGKFCPFFNEIIKVEKESFNECKTFLLNLPIENYLTINVSKLNIQKYKDIFTNLNSVAYVQYSQKAIVYRNIFAKTLKNYDLNNTTLYQAIYFLNFMAKNNLQVFVNDNIHPSWKNKKIWERIVMIRNKQHDKLPYLSVYLDILGFHFDFDTIEFCQKPFYSIQNDVDNLELVQRAAFLAETLNAKFPKKISKYLSLLLEKSYKYKKYKLVQYLIKRGVYINNFADIFSIESSPQSQSKIQRVDQRNKMVELMKVRQPEMFRRYQWEQLINVKLKQEKKENLVVLNTIQKDKFYVNKDIYSHLVSKDVMNNTISRKDYMFCNNRLIAKLNMANSEAYIQVTEYPLLRYFYTFFMNALGKGSLVLNFCGFFGQKGNLIHLIESIPQCFNFQKGLHIHSQNELKNFTNQDDISEAIIISMMLMPTNVLLKNIIISPLTYEGQSVQERKSLFIIDFHDFYQKNGFESNGGNTVLKVRNSLFIFEEMRNIISERLMKKYSSLNVLEIINNVFIECMNFISLVNKQKPARVDELDDEKQLLSLIFQNGFLEQVVQRMFKIKCAFAKNIKNKKNINHLELLQILDPPLSFYYQEIITSANTLFDREKIMLDDSWKKSLIISEKMINFLPNSYYIEQARDIFPNHYRRFGFQGPTENLSHLYHNILKFSIYTDKITELTEYSHQVIEYFIRNIDLSYYSKDQKEALISRMQEYSKEYLNREKNCLPLSVIRFNNIDSVKEKNLKFSDERLKELIFEDINCSESEFNSLLKKYLTISHLILKNVAGVEKIGETILSISETHDIKNLRYLSIIGCPNLTVVDLKCDELEQVTFRRNSALSEIYLFSKRLKNMDCSECPKLRLQNIGIYILKKVNVLLCKNSSDGDVQNLEDSNYSIFLTRILGYLFNKFEESNFFKLELIITLIKLELIDEKLFGFKNSQISKSLVNFVAKAKTQILNLVLIQLFDIFLNNDLVDIFNIDELLYIPSISLKLIETYFWKLAKERGQKHLTIKKEFKYAIFKNYKIIPELYLNHLSFIKSAIEYLEVDKTFKLTLNLSEHIHESDYIQLIDTINKKQKLERFELVIENSKVKESFILALFTLNHIKNKISKLQFNNCKVSVSSQLTMNNQSNVKTVVFNKCQIKCSQFLLYFVNINCLQLHSCSIITDILQFYGILGNLKTLETLSLVNLKEYMPNKDMKLEMFFVNLQKLEKLKEFDFSSNRMNYTELCYFSQTIQHVRLSQLNLYNFYAQDSFKNIKDFLFHEHLKVIGIQINKKDTALIESFINSLSSNKSIIRLNLRSDQEIQSSLFEEMKKNNKLETIQSNQPIPNWLKNHINHNSTNKSVIVFDSSISMGSANKNQDFYRIGLSLDGGGVRGMLLATQLHYLSTQIGQPLHKIFDCIGGTSIGGILALASTGSLDGRHPVCSTQDCIDIFQIYGNKIFKKTQFQTFANILQTKYDVRSFQELLSGYFKQGKLSDVLPETNVLVTAVNRLTNQDVIFRSLNSIFDRNQDFYLKDIARATSAAPTYFPSAEIKNINASQKFSLLDGGVGLNNPSKLVIDDVIKISQNEVNKKNYFLLSLGTGRLKNQAIPEKAGYKDIAPIIDSFTESATYFIEKDLTENYKGHYLRVSPLINLRKGDGQLDNTSPEILKVYKQTGQSAAEEYFSKTIAYGKYKNQNLIEWLAENTARKYDL